MAKTNCANADSPTPDVLNGDAIAAVGWKKRFESLCCRRAIIFLYFFIMHIYNSLKNNYKQKYGNARTSVGTNRDRHTAKYKSEEVPTQWQWQTFPRIYPRLVRYQRVTTIYMAYVVIKNVSHLFMPTTFERPLELLSTSRPLHCYALGRFLPNVGARRKIASLFCFYHLTWRYFQFYVPSSNYMISTLYFLMLDDRDIANYYKLLRRTRRPSWSEHSKPYPVHIKDEHSTREERLQKMFHDIMSARLDCRDKIVYKLRPNRTQAANRQLRDFLINHTICGATVFGLCVMVVGPFFMFIGLPTTRYIEDYPGCSPELEKLYEQNDSQGWHMHLRGHQMLTIIVDGFENAVIWTETGLVATFYMPLSMLLTYDLILYWNYLDNRVKSLLEQQTGQGDEVIRWNVSQSDNAIFEHLMEWQDFVIQVKHADAFISDALTMAILGWLTLLGGLIHDSIRSRKENLPFSIGLLLLFAMANMSIMNLGMLVLHRRCLRGYTRFCSLMAHDKSKHKMRFIEILDYFTRGRTCFTICRKRKMTTTTYLTIIGWSFSCFFILGSLYRN